MNEESLLKFLSSLFFHRGGLYAYGLLGIFFLLFIFFTRNKKRKKLFDFEGARGEVVAHLPHGRYQVRVHGELWSGESTASLNIGERVYVTKQQSSDLILKILPLESS